MKESLTEFYFLYEVEREDINLVLEKDILKTVAALRKLN